MFTDAPGDSPLTAVPPDYDGGGTGRWFLLPDGPDAGRRLYFWERRLGDGDGPVVLLVHGNPECSYTYRHVVQRLRAADLPPGTRVVAVDHLGFGRSDQARFEMVDMHHAANLRALVRALDLRDVTLVVHDWGGPIGIGALLDDPDRVRGLVVLNSTVFPIPSDGPTYQTYPFRLLPWARTPTLVPDRLWGAMAAAVVTMPRTGVTGLTTASVRAAAQLRPGGGTEAEAVFRQQFASTANVRSSKRMVRQTPVWGHGYRYDDPRLGPQDNTPFYRSIQQRLPEAWGSAGSAIPVAAVFGAWDPLAKLAVLAQWAAALPQVRDDTSVLAGVSHFVEEHRAAEVAAAVARVVRGGR
ncbi:alpha/beta fold hydrolase [Nocardioides sp. SYSU DS0651]|uniref:alpha/beta fold hydrolase n=1 Tax=Nocardioides sp. SYSU DS0651 TaxID=3415955 RepID=UPI003F4B72C1